MNETEAILYVLEGGHPANCIGRVSSSFPKDNPSQDFIYAIPDEWHKFRVLMFLLRKACR